MMTEADYVSRYLAGSGVISWDSSSVTGCRVDPVTVTSLRAAAVLEEDTGISAAYARSFGLDRAPDFRAYLPVWEPEEAEHARILRAIVAGSGVTDPNARSRTIPMRRRGGTLLPLRALGRSPATGLVYCALGAAAEYLAVTSYTALTARVEDKNVSTLLQAITRQEGRHLAFFLGAARARSATTPPAHARLARRALARIWEPIGVSSLGRPAWRAMNGHWLDDDGFRVRVARMDAVIDTIPQLSGLGLMERFLRDWDSP